MLPALLYRPAALSSKVFFVDTFLALQTWRVVLLFFRLYASGSTSFPYGSMVYIYIYVHTHTASRGCGILLSGLQLGLDYDITWSLGCDFHRSPFGRMMGFKPHVSRLCAKGSMPAVAQSFRWSTQHARDANNDLVTLPLGLLYTDSSTLSWRVPAVGEDYIFKDLPLNSCRYHISTLS